MTLLVPCVHHTFTCLCKLGDKFLVNANWATAVVNN